MSESDDILKTLGELSKPATVLIEKISDAVGGIFRPYQIRRVAGAEADAATIQAKTNIQISELQRRAMQRFLVEEGQKQENIESITQKALPYVAPDAKPEDVENDWITNFFDKSRLVSDEDMQALWAKVLAGEANSPGSYSKRTISLLSSMDKVEAELFKKLCSFVWQFGGLTPLIYDVLDPIYKNSGITFDSLQHLDLIGLINFDGLAGFTRTFNAPSIPTSPPFQFMTAYYGTPYKIFLQSVDPFDIGKVLLTTPGAQLALITGSTPNEDFRSYILERWKVFQVTPIANSSVS